METNYKDIEIIMDFYDYLLAKNKAIGTINEYCINIFQFLYFIKEYKKIDIPLKDFGIFIILDIKEEDIYLYQIFLNANRKNSVATRNLKLSSIKVFFKYIYIKYHLYCKGKENPAINILFANKPERLPKFLNLDQAKQLCNVYSIENTKNWIRNNTIIYFLLSTGLRRRELINLNINNIDFEKNEIRVVCKGNKERTLYINNKCKNMILKYLETRNVKLDSSEPVFISSQNRRLNENTLRYIVLKAYKLIGISEKGYSIHTLRHTAATIMYKETKGDLLLVKEFLGHSSISATQIYTHVEDEALRKVVNSNPLNYIEEKREKNGI